MHGHKLPRQRTRNVTFARQPLSDRPEDTNRRRSELTESIRSQSENESHVQPNQVKLSGSFDSEREYDAVPKPRRAGSVASYGSTDSGVSQPPRASVRKMKKIASLSYGELTTGKNQGQVERATGRSRPDFECTWCKERFIRAYDMRNHIRAHRQGELEQAPGCLSKQREGHSDQEDLGQNTDRPGDTGGVSFICTGSLMFEDQNGCGQRFDTAELLQQHCLSKACFTSDGDLPLRSLTMALNSHQAPLTLSRFLNLDEVRDPEEDSDDYMDESAIEDDDESVKDWWEDRRDDLMTFSIIPKSTQLASNFRSSLEDAPLSRYPESINVVETSIRQRAKSAPERSLAVESLSGLLAPKTKPTSYWRAWNWIKW